MRRIENRLLPSLGRAPSPMRAAWVLGLALASCAGCGSPFKVLSREGWLGDYERAERLARSEGTGLVIFYRDTPAHRPDPMYDAVQTAAKHGDKRHYERCVLGKTYEPNRRYVAQFGVRRAPALIVVHPDGTYHARTGLLSDGQVADFLATARPPGDTPVWDPFVSREPDYGWITSLDAAQVRSQQTGKPMLVVFDRFWSRDWRRLEKLLHRPEVHRRFANMVHCRPRSLWSFSKTRKTRFGTLRLPAIVLARPDGEYDVLELPCSCEAVVRFADAARRGAHETVPRRPHISAFGSP